MNKAGRYYLLGVFIIIVSISIAAGIKYWQNCQEEPALKVINLFARNHTEGQYSVLVDMQYNVLDMMARKIYIGDEFIAPDNKRYKVVHIDGNKAICEEIGLEKLSFDYYGGSEKGTETVIPVEGKRNQIIGVYYTHDDESYVPTEGTESKPQSGGVLEVGNVFVNQLRSRGINVIEDKTSHSPHDDSAYRRSRRTAVSLLKKGAAALFDIHRDGVPDSNFYRVIINNKPATMIRLVVGRQNQNMSSNLDFAKRIKAAADKKYPGLIKGIFLGSGSYNQDLSPRSALIEVGTYTNPRYEAERGTTFFADIIPPVLGTAATPVAAETKSTSADWKGVFLIILGLVVGGGAFLLLSSGGWEKAVDRLKNFTSTEGLNLLTWRKKTTGNKRE